MTLVVRRGDPGRDARPDAARSRSTARYRLGFVLRGEKLGVGESVWQSIRLTGVVTREIGKSLGRLAHGQGRKDIASPVGIGQTLNTAQKQGAQSYLWVLGLISLSLALMNLLPLLPLDGGHIAFSVVEGIRGRAVAREVYERVSAVGIASSSCSSSSGSRTTSTAWAEARLAIQRQMAKWQRSRSRSAASRSAAARPSSCSR